MSVQGYCSPRVTSGTIRKLGLTPAFLISHHSRNKEALRDPVAREDFKLNPGDFPRFLWEGETMDASDPTIGFLRHPILFAVRMADPLYI